MSTRRRWTPETITLELRAQVAEHGRWPTYRELEARGLGAMVRAMRRLGDRAYWEAAVAEERPAAPEKRPRRARSETVVPQPATPPREHIAVRAYFLYRNGHPGDQLSHWLAAEQQLGAAA